MNEAVTILRDDEGTRGAYRAKVPGTDKFAILTWRADGRPGGKIRIADHTFVPPEARGKGIAMQLVEALIADARELGFTVAPHCSYVAAAFRRNPDWADLRA